MMPWIERVATSWWEWMLVASLQITVLIGVISLVPWMLRSRSALLLHGLWLIVLAKAFFPPFILMRAESMPSLAAVMPTATMLRATNGSEPISDATAVSGISGRSMGIPAGRVSPIVLLLAIWMTGVAVFWWIVARNHRVLSKAIQGIEPLDEGPLRIAYEKVGLVLGIDNCPDLIVTDRWTSPFLVGVTNPSVVMPASVVRNASENDIAVVMAHELVHYQRRDTWIGWLQVVALSLFWFHPVFWWAMRQLRQSREEACDEAVLRKTLIAAEDYGDAMLRLVTKAQAKLLDGVGLVGVFERSTQIQVRLEKIMTFKKNEKSFGWGSKLVLALASLALLPLVLVRPSEAKEAGSKTPQIVSTVPVIGATDVALSTTEIRVTFDRDMSSGMSWAGGPPHFPAANDDAKPRWIDKRTCVLPVKLERGHYYRVGINSKSFTNFKSVDGVAANPSAIYFATEGATPEVIALTKTPEVVQIEPANGATDVDANVTAIVVTFNMPMGEGMSWIGGGAEFPVISKDKRPSWSTDKLSCTLPVKLEPGITYRMGLNSKSHTSFQSAGGVPLQPMEYSFQTK
jgi:beta-lactamase regulating signal transducer with metallopeptidase domain